MNRTGGLARDHALPKLNVWYESLILRHTQDPNRIDERFLTHAIAAPNSQDQERLMPIVSLESGRTVSSDLNHGFKRDEDRRVIQVTPW